jgi:hypothetical protein
MVRKNKEPDAAESGEQAGTETDNNENASNETKKTRQTGLYFNNPELPQPTTIYELIEFAPEAIKSVKFIWHKKSGLLRAINITLINQADLEELHDAISGGNVLNEYGVLHCGVVNKLKEVLVKC